MPTDIHSVAFELDGSRKSTEKFVALKRIRLLGSLEEPGLWELVHAGKWSRLPPRSVIVREGESGRSLYLLGSGQAKVTRQGRLLNVLDSGECFTGDLTMETMVGTEDPAVVAASWARLRAVGATTVHAGHGRVYSLPPSPAVEG